MSTTPAYQDVLANLKRVIEHAVRGSGSEPAFVWRLFSVGLPEVSRQLKAAYAGQINVNGVYCHGSPVVDFTHIDEPATPKGCELGDLLVVVHHVFPGGSGQRRAMLLQCKMADRPSVPIRQRLLYADWPVFTYRANATASRKLAPAPHPGAKFAFIDASSGQIYVDQGAVKPDPYDPWGDSLACALTTMLGPANAADPTLFLADRHQVADKSGWSRIVWDLLKTTFSGERYRSKSRVLAPIACFLETREPPRLLTASLFAAEARAFWSAAVSGSDDERMRIGHDGPPLDDRPADDAEPYDAGGISTILIEVDWTAAPDYGPQ